MYPYILLPLLCVRLFTAPAEALKETAPAVARPHFEQGLLLLHNFEYIDAAEQFVLAQEKDPGFVLSYWGEAMTYDHPVWRNGNPGKARAALAKIGATPSERRAKAKTPLERDLMAGVEILFGEGSKASCDSAYAVHMAGLYKRYPDNRDVAAFYALSLLATKKDWTKWEDHNVQAALIAQDILNKDPDHPGALHYLIHADDHPLYAHRGLDAADRYAKVASYAGHALHMPSHIYLVLGKWDEVVRSNEVSWQAGIDRKERKDLDNDALNYHAHWWLAYGYLQQGRFGRALERLENQVRYVQALPSGVAYFHLLQMKGHYLFHTDDWDGPVADIPIDDSKLDNGDRCVHSLLNGYRLFWLNKSSELADLINKFEGELTKAAQLQKAREDVAVCGLTRYVPTEAQLRTARRYLHELKGLQAWMTGDAATAEKHFRESLPSEGSVVIGPPVFLISPHELYGQFLLAQDRPAEALHQFEKALAASPNRYMGLKGKLTAAIQLGDTDAERKAREQLERNLKHADPEARKGIW